MIAVLTMVFLSLVSKVWAQDCIFNSFSKTSPYIVDENYNFPSTLHFEPEDLFYITCPRGTTSPYLAEEGDRAVCKGGTSILNIRSIEILDFKNIECKSTIFPTSVQDSNEACGSNSTLIDVGYKIYRGFVSVISVCFNQAKLAPFYVKFKNMARLSRDWSASSNYNLDLDLVCASENRNCDFVDSGGLFSNLDVDDIYLNQNQIFENLGINVNDRLLKFPLAVNSFISFPQHVENYPFWDYVNVVPMWSTTYEMWVNIRNFLRGTTDSYYLYIGSLGVATLPNTAGNSVELYLGNNQIPVPKWVWAVFERDDSPDFEVAVVFVYNSVFELQDYADVCKDWGNLDKNIILCLPEWITDPQIKMFLADTVCKIRDCQTKGYLNVTNFKWQKD